MVDPVPGEGAHDRPGRLAQRHLQRGRGEQAGGDVVQVRHAELAAAVDVRPDRDAHAEQEHHGQQERAEHRRAPHPPVGGQAVLEHRPRRRLPALQRRGSPRSTATASVLHQAAAGQVQEHVLQRAAPHEHAARREAAPVHLAGRRVTVRRRRAGSGRAAAPPGHRCRRAYPGRSSSASSPKRSSSTSRVECLR